MNQLHNEVRKCQRKEKPNCKKWIEVGMCDVKIKMLCRIKGIVNFN